MKILLVHNHYLNPGGEDQVFAAEAEVLRAHGEQVRVYTRHNDAVASMDPIRLATATVWNREVLRELTDVVCHDPPDLVHFHNTFPLVSPAAYEAARHLGIPVVQTLHNFRLLCLNGLFLRQGRMCEDCLGKAVPWPGVVHACYRQSHRASMVAGAMISIHRWRETWTTAVDTYIAMSEFARLKFVSGGLPADRIVVKPNFLETDPGPGNHRGGFALYVGRLSPEKGVGSLVRLWAEHAVRMPLRIIGSGPLESLASNSSGNVEWLGWQSRPRVLDAMREAAFLVFPTECYEGFPMVLLEAMATGLPVLAPRYGSVPDVVQDTTTGLLVRPGDARHWAEVVDWAIDHQPEMAVMGTHARREFERKYTADRGYRLLMEVYHRTLDRGPRVPMGAGWGSAPC